MTRRLAAALLIVFAVTLYFGYRHSHSGDKWEVTGCRVVKDESAPEGKSIRVTLRGPTLIEGAAPFSVCAIVIGTPFTDREDGDICFVKGGMPCYKVLSETQR